MTSSPKEAVLGVMVVMLVVAMFIPFAGEGWPRRAKQIARRSWNYITTVLWVVAAVTCFLVGFLAVVVWKPRSLLLLADLVRFLASEWDESSFPSTPTSQTPTHDDPRGLIKQMFIRALRDRKVPDVYLENILLLRNGLDWICVLNSSPITDCWRALAVFHADGEWIELIYYRNRHDRFVWERQQRPQPTKESP